MAGITSARCGSRSIRQVRRAGQIRYRREHGRLSFQFRAVRADRCRCVNACGLLHDSNGLCAGQRRLLRTAPVDAYRGAGRPEAIYAIERLVDFAAQEIGLSPDEMRRRGDSGRCHAFYHGFRSGI